MAKHPGHTDPDDRLFVKQIPAGTGFYYQCSVFNTDLGFCNPRDMIYLAANWISSRHPSLASRGPDPKEGTARA